MPKTGGFGYVVAALGERVHQVLDVTIVYPNGAPSFWEFISGQCRDVRVEIASSRVPSELFDAHEELPALARSYSNRGLQCMTSRKISQNKETNRY